MDFKFSPDILAKARSINAQPIYGYQLPDSSFWNALSNWVKTRLHEGAVVDESTTLLWNNMHAVINGVIHTTTEPGDEVLIPCPAYYRFFNFTLKSKRVPV